MTEEEANELIDALSTDEPACHYRCGVPEEDRCMSPVRDTNEPNDSSWRTWRCSLRKGHRGPHVACEWHGTKQGPYKHARHVWRA